MAKSLYREKIVLQRYIENCDTWSQLQEVLNISLDIVKKRVQKSGEKHAQKRCTLPAGKGKTNQDRE